MQHGWTVSALGQKPKNRLYFWLILIRKTIVLQAVFVGGKSEQTFRSLKAVVDIKRFSMKYEPARREEIYTPAL